MKSKSNWQKLPNESLRRYRPTGVYYVWKRVGSRHIRQSLQTIDLEVARGKRDELLKMERSAAWAGATAGRTMTLAQAVDGNITKNGRPREIPILRPIRLVIERWLAEPNRRRSSYLCPVWKLYRALKMACIKLKFPVRLSHHDFRHLFITDLLLKYGVEAAMIARWVGHTDNGKLIRETYTLVSEQWEREEIERLNGIYA